MFMEISMKSWRNYNCAAFAVAVYVTLVPSESTDYKESIITVLRSVICTTPGRIEKPYSGFV